MSFEARPRVLILGSGFGAFALATRLDPRAFEVVVVSPRNHFLFTPLLPSAALGTLEFRTIIEPLRRGRRHLAFRLGAAEAVDLAGKRVRCRAADGATWEEPFDFLVIAVGARSNTFGTPGAREHAFFLKELADARRIREALVANLERASLPATAPEERDRLLHFVAVGGGPTGVRFAAELHDLLLRDVPRSYPDLAGRARITVLDAAAEILGTYDEPLRRYTTALFRRRRIEVRAGARVAEVSPGGVRLADGAMIPAGLVLWATGFAPLPFVEALSFAKDRRGRILTDPALRVLGERCIFALGDCARPEPADLPQLAEIAEQQGRYLARAIPRAARSAEPAPFVWRSRGMATYLGGATAVFASADGDHAVGARAYWRWRTGVFSDLVSVRNKVLVPLDRLRAKIFGRDLSKF
jgi:NADH:ubiquinone reductase (non-electrogenic)